MAVLVFNRAPCHEDMWVLTFTIDGDELSASFAHRSPYCWGKSLRYQWN